jgi:polar amino acid transport system substrate-binding protein
MRRKTLALVAMAAVFMLVAAGCSKKADTTAIPSGSIPSGTATSASPPAAALDTVKPGVLTVGSCLDYKPFEYTENGVLKGFDVEIMQAIADNLGLQLEWTKHDFDTIFTAVQANQFDAVAAASTITDERLQQVSFSDPYYAARQSLTVNITKTPSIATTDDLKAGDIIGAQKGTTGLKWAKDNLASKGIVINTYTEAPDAFTDLEAGQITGVINDEPSSESEVENRPDLKVIQPIDTGENYGIAVAQNRPDILAAINAGLAAIIADGTYKTIFETYFPGVPVPPQFGG